MKTDFWKEKWKAGEIGFHRDAYNPNLLKWWHRVEAEKQDVVLVPLCGKTLDLRWLAGGNHAVIGAEVSSVAVNAFFEELGVEPETVEGNGQHRLHQLGRLTIVEGDFFQWGSLNLPRATRFYDRAACIALPPDMRADYFRVLHDALAPGALGLFLTIGYPDGEMNGPPFSVPPEALRSMTSGLFELDLLSDSDAFEPGGPMASRGLSALREYVFQARRLS